MIDAPQSAGLIALPGLDGARKWPCGDFATAALEGLTEGAEIRCEVYGRDHYQRALAVCYAGELDLNGGSPRAR